MKLISISSSMLTSYPCPFFRFIRNSSIIQKDINAREFGFHIIHGTTEAFLLRYISNKLSAIEKTVPEEPSVMGTVFSFRFI
jgi:hypothetical protein